MRRSRRAGRPSGRGGAPRLGAGRFAGRVGGALAAAALPLAFAGTGASPAAAAVHHPAPLVALGSFGKEAHHAGGGVVPWLWVGGSLAVTGGLLVVVDTRRRRQLH